MLSLVADLAVKAVILNPHLGRKAAKESPGLVLIDELDLHLHPKWQRRVVDDLKRTFPRIQFICTTHSPFLIQALEPGELLRLDKEGVQVEYENQSLEDIVESVQGVKMPQRSARAEKMSKSAQKYFGLVRLGKKAPAKQLQEAEREYRLASEPFTNQPALHALLKLETIAAKTKA
jgi:predicted ATP-binding protein involved in virulence